MANYFDRRGNIYQIEDTDKLQKKEYVEVFNEAGEEFHLKAEVADEFKLTPDERVAVIRDVLTRLGDLARTIGTAGCPNIDPPDIDAVRGTRINPRIADVLRGLGGGCPNIDPVDFGNIGGTRVNPAIADLVRGLRAGCPNIDPADPDNVRGTRVNLADLLRGLDAGCPNIDPFRIGTILGSLGPLR